jgi:hypothetical protein
MRNDVKNRENSRIVEKLNGVKRREMDFYVKLKIFSVNIKCCETPLHSS